MVRTRGWFASGRKCLGETVVTDLADPFLVTELSGGDLTADPARLADEVAAISLTGGRRLIRIRDVGDAAAPILKSVLETGTGDTMTVLQAGQLGPRSALRKLAESHAAAAAIPCYVDDDASLERVIRETLASHDVSISAEASVWLVGRLGSDRAVSRGEAEKLALYAGPGGQLGLEATMACIGDSASESLDDLIYAAADGDSNAVDLGIMRCFQAGSSAVGILRAMTNHLLQLEAAGVRIQSGEDAGAVLKSLRPPIFFKLERRFRGTTLDLAGTGARACLAAYARCGIELQAHRYSRGPGLRARAIANRELSPATRTLRLVQPISPGAMSFCKTSSSCSRVWYCSLSVPASPRSSISTFRPR